MRLRSLYFPDLEGTMFVGKQINFQSVILEKAKDRDIVPPHLLCLKQNKVSAPAGVGAVLMALVPCQSTRRGSVTGLCNRMVN